LGLVTFGALVGCEDASVSGGLSDATAASPDERSSLAAANPAPRADDHDRPAGDAPAQPPAQGDPAEQDPIEKEADEDPFPRSLKSPSLAGGVQWLNTSGPLEVRDLKGKFVILDFWTYCCINCMHILPELKKLEQAYPNEVVVIGVHSAKFTTEKDTANIRAAVLRHGIEHPVVNDANQAIWDKFALEGWPGLRVIDPQGRLVAGHGGEITFEDLDRFLKMTLPYYKKRGLLDETPVRFALEEHKALPTPLRFPGKVLADAPSDRLFISDSSNNRIVVARLDGTLLAVIGDGQPGAKDGDFATARFDHPQGMALRGEVLYVADTDNHLLRKVDLAREQVATIAGTGKQQRREWPGVETDEAGFLLKMPDRFYGPPRKTALNSPWDLVIHGNDLFIAMAGPHQIWRMPLDETEIGVYAGNGREDIVDGPTAPERPYARGSSSFAQPSGLASDGQWIYVADSEGSSIRAVPLDPAKDVRTLVGTAHLQFARLFTFGDVDGTAPDARLQHCLGVAFDRGLLYVADTYNNKIKVLDLADESIKTLVGSGKAGLKDRPPQFDEPNGLSAAAGKLYVADTNNHAIRVIDLAAGNKVTTLEIKGLKPPTPPQIQTAPDLSRAKIVEVAKADVKPADRRVRFAVELKLPEGWKINPEAPMSYLVLPSNGGGGVMDRSQIGKAARLKPPAAKFEVAVPVTAAPGDDVVQLAVNYYYCQEDGKGLCKAGTVVFKVPLAVSAEAKDEAVALEYSVEEAPPLAGSDGGERK
jgi:sugar lactone lactonase YvrE/thiol-disulfide isomerase/thioredoxin